jgi:glycosyltransferase involved in cell wall biosynthesis
MAFKFELIKVEILIEAMKSSEKINWSIEIVIAGTNSPNLGLLRISKGKICTCSGITFTGYVEENEVQNIFNDSAMVVFPHLPPVQSIAPGSYGKAVVMPDLGFKSAS